MNALQTRLPTRQELLPVYSIVAFFAFSWTLYRLFWYIPSWLDYLSLWSVLVIAAYALAFALVESLCVLGLVALISLAFPTRMFKELFVPVGSSLAALLSIGAVLLQRRINLVYRLELWQLIAYPLALLALAGAAVLILSALFGRFPRLAGWVSGLAERMTVFAYVYSAFGLVGLAVALVRNLLRF